MGGGGLVIEPWAGPLIGLGLAQLLGGIAIIAAGGMTIGKCDEYAYVSFAIIPGVFLALTGFVTISAFKCNTRMLLGLGIWNILMFFAALSATASGGVGIRCEGKGNHDGVGCDTMRDHIPNCIEVNNNTRLLTVLQDQDTHGKRVAVQATILLFSLLEMIFCGAVAALSFRARSHNDKGEIGGSTQVAVATVVTPSGGGGGGGTVASAGPAGAQTVTAPSMPAGGINICNTNTVNVATNVTGGKVETDANTGGPPPPQQAPPPPQYPPPQAPYNPQPPPPQYGYQQPGPGFQQPPPPPGYY